jgi:protocatechuate 3,4-dioxygenase beta subunit
MMDLLRSLFLGVLLLLPSQNPQPTVVIEGQVQQADVIGDPPIENARIELQGGTQDSIYARTDATGHFRLTNVPPGQYQLTAMAAGYVSLEYGQRSGGQPGGKLTVAPGVRIDPPVFKLVRAATITGRVQDSENVPLADVSVQVYRRTYGLDGRLNLISVMGTRTNDRGEYRLYWLTPDEYYVSASPSAGRSGPAFTPLNPNLPASRAGYPAWFYPGVPDLLHAVPIQLNPGELRETIDFHFTPMPTVSVSGTVIDQRTGSGTFAQLILSQMGDLRSSGLLQGLSDTSGKFQFIGVASGTYTVNAYSTTDNAQGTRTIDVIDKNVTDLRIVLEAGFSVRGRVVPDPEDPSLKLPQLSVTLIPGGNAQTQADGTFEIKNARSGSSTLVVSGLTEGLYIKSATFGRSNAMTDSLPDPGEIRPALASNGVLLPMTPGQILISPDSKDSVYVVISAASGRLKGTVTDAGGKPFSAARVVLAPEEKFRGIRPLYKVTTSDQSGEFSIRGIPPGSYTLFVFDVIDTGAYYNREFMRPYEGSGVPVVIEQKIESTVSAQVIEHRN